MPPARKQEQIQKLLRDDLIRLEVERRGSYMNKIVASRLERPNKLHEILKKAVSKKLAIYRLARE